MPEDTPSSGRPERSYDRSAEARYRPFHSASATVALALAVGGGFGLAALLSIYVGFELSVGGWWLPVLQAHGHIQLLAWLGLFIIGVSLYFVPRLAGVPISRPGLVPWVVITVAAGVALRGTGQVGMALMPGSAARWVLGVSGVVTLVGIGGYVILMLVSVQAARAREALASVKIFFGMAFVGWGLFGLLNVALTTGAALSASATVDLSLNRLAVRVFTTLVLVPVALAFAVRTFPLYLRLRPPNWPVRAYGLAYLAATTAILVAEALRVQGIAGDLASPLASLGGVAYGLVLIAIIWQVDVLTRRKSPWTAQRVGEPGPDRRPTRPGLPDYGEFGRFELFLIVAFIWLFLGAAGDVAAGGSSLLGFPMLVDMDALRHIYLAGFMSSLLLGMAPRMLPGFMHKRGVAYPGLVGMSFVFWLPATVGRIFPLLAGSWLPDAALGALLYTFALSGTSGLIAILLLAVNLVATVRS